MYTCITYNFTYRHFFIITRQVVDVKIVNGQSAVISINYILQIYVHINTTHNADFPGSLSVKFISNPAYTSMSRS